MSEKLVNFRADEEKYNELKMLALKEKTTVKAGGGGGGTSRFRS